MKQVKETRTVKSLTIEEERAFLMNASGGVLQEFSTKALLEKNPTLKAKAFGCDVLIIHIYAPVSVRGGKGTRLFSWVEGAEALANARGVLSYAMVKGAYSYAMVKRSCAYTMSDGAEAIAMVKGSYSYRMVKGSYSYRMVKGSYSYRMVKGLYSYGMIKGSYSLVQTPLAS